MRFKRMFSIALAAAVVLPQPGWAAPVQKSARIKVARDKQVISDNSELEQLGFHADSDRRMASYSYGDMLVFARCVMRFDPAAAHRAMEVPIGDDSEANFSRMADSNRSCLQRSARIHPLLIRAALAEAAMGLPAEARELRNPIGVPAVAKGRPLRATSRCQVETAPALVEAVFGSRPGSDEERGAVAALFAAAPDCGEWDLEKTSPTVARLSLIEARYQLAH